MKAMGALPRCLLEKELESVGIRLNKHKPNIYFKVRPLSPAGCSAGGSGLCQPVAEARGAVAAGPSSAGLPSPLLLQPKKGGGISFNSTVTLTQCSEKLVQLILHEYSILNEWAVRGTQSLQSTGAGGWAETALQHQEQQASWPLEQALRKLWWQPWHEGLLTPLPACLLSGGLPDYSLAGAQQWFPGSSPTMRCYGGRSHLEGHKTRWQGKQPLGSRAS